MFLETSWRKSTSGEGKYYACITVSHILLLSYVNHHPPPIICIFVKYKKNISSFKKKSKNNENFRLEWTSKQNI